MRAFLDASASSSSVTGDDLLGTVGTLVGATLTAGRMPSGEPESVIRGTLILNLNNSPITEELTPLGGRPIPIFADNVAPPSADPVSSSSIRPFSDTFGVVDNLTPVLLFANPFSG